MADLSLHPARPPTRGAERPAPEVETLRSLEARRLVAMRTNDAAALEDLLAPGMMYVHESGRAYERDAYIRAIETHALTYRDDVDLCEEMVKLWPEAMISSGLMRGHALLDGERQVFNLRYMAIWLMFDGRWRLAWVQKTPLLPDLRSQLHGAR